MIYKRGAVAETLYLDSHVLQITPPFMHLALHALQMARASTVVAVPLTSAAVAAPREMHGKGLSPSTATKRLGDNDPSSPLKQQRGEGLTAALRRAPVSLGVLEISDSEPDSSSVRAGQAAGTKDDPIIVE